MSRTDPTVYDHRRSRKVAQVDLPDDITPQLLGRFCRSHGCAFFSRETLTFDGKGLPTWTLTDDGFRVGTQEVPSRGLNSTFEKVREWRVAVMKGNNAEARAICEELPRLQARALAAGMFKTAAALNVATQGAGWEAADMLENAAAATPLTPEVA